MISKLQAFFKQHLHESGSNNTSLAHRLKLAHAVLMVEIIYADETVSEEEKNSIEKILEQKFQLQQKEIKDLLELAEEKKHEATDYYQFTSLLNEHYSQPQKVKLVEDLWALAYADNTLDKHEEHLIRRLADLLHVPHSAFMQSKHRVKQS